MKRFTVTATPYNCGSRARTVPGLSVGDVFMVEDHARPDRDGDYFGHREGTESYCYVNKNTLTEITTPAPPTSISLVAFRKAQTALPGTASVETVLSVAQAIEAGI